MNYRPEIDGLRALAVLPVILFHAGFWPFSGGFLGVDVFFVISGYLITSIIASELDKGKFTIGRFYERRARRILPALFVVIIACFPAAWLSMSPAELDQFGQGLISVGVFGSNIFFWTQEGYFSPGGELNPLLHTWSLAVEEQFYIFFPLLMIAIFRYAPKYLFICIAILTLGSLVLAQVASLVAPGAGFYLLSTRAWELGVGVLCALLLKGREHRGNDWLSGLGLLLIFVAILSFDKNTPTPSFYTMVPVGGTAMLILFAKQSGVVGRLLSLGPIVKIGLISYSAYLWHNPLFVFARLQVDEPSQGLFAGLAILSILLAYVSWRFVEQPFRRQTNTLVLNRSRVFVTSVIGLCLFTGVGSFLAITNGALYRYPLRDHVLFKQLSPQAIKAYVPVRFNENLDRQFESMQDAVSRVLVIGDSYGQDFVNVIMEAAPPLSVDVSTHYIPAGCGNLYLADDFSGQIAEHKQAGCALAIRYASPRLMENMKDADFIVLASSWTGWEIDRLPESVARLSKLTQGTVIVVGPKIFRKFSANDIRMTSGQDRHMLDYPRPRYHLDAIKEMASEHEGQFINISDAICGEGDRCRAFTPAGELISADGRHLT